MLTEDVGAVEVELGGDDVVVVVVDVGTTVREVVVVAGAVIGGSVEHPVRTTPAATASPAPTAVTPRALRHRNGRTVRARPLLIDLRTPHLPLT